MNPNDKLYQRYIKAGWTWKRDERSDAIFWFDEQGQQRCGAKRANLDEVCRQTFLNDNGRCRRHGGETLKGSAHPSFKNGLYSKHLPSKLAERVNELLQDEKLMDLRQNVALTDARLAMLLETLGDGELALAWLRLKELIRDSDSALKLQHIDEFALYWIQIKKLVEEGAKQYLVWNEVLTLNERKRRLVETTEKVSLMGERSISVADHLAIVTSITETFLSHIKDAETKRKVIAEIQRIAS